MRYLVGVIFLVSIACKGKNVPAVETPDFQVFYDRFHRDTSFQMERIVFPLKGLPANADSLTYPLSEFRWNKDGWVLHRPFDTSLQGFDHTVTELGEGLILESFLQKDAQVAMERRFAVVDGDWYLIYYAGMNPVGR